MAKNYATLAFTDQVKDLQKRFGSRSTYQLVEKRHVVTGLTEAEIDFVHQRDSFYISTIGENGFPYIQHRGGPKGFVRLIDNNTLGFIDFAGNKQYISVGNLTTQKNAAVIFMDYTAPARLKIYARAEVVELNDRPDFFSLLALENYKHRPERMIVLHVEAYDWNCPQHITPRFTEEEIEEALAPQREYIKQLEAELKELKSK